ncbi:hypothetical protein L209DRAFT_584828 [Thermothelomyces heterothallicus CBS 203.75]
MVGRSSSKHTADAPPAAAAEEGQGMDPNQTVNAYVHPPLGEPNYICGPKAGVGQPRRFPSGAPTDETQPYVAEHSHNLFTQLGARIAFLGIDARTEVSRCPPPGFILNAPFGLTENSGRDIRSTTRRRTTPSSPA